MNNISMESNNCKVIFVSESLVCMNFERLVRLYHTQML